MDLATIMSIVTFFVTLILGFVSKKSKYVSNQLIPLQNLCVGIISGLIYYLITKDINLVVMSVGLGTGGAYDLVHNFMKLFDKPKEEV